MAALLPLREILSDTMMRNFLFVTCLLLVVVGASSLGTAEDTDGERIPAIDDRLLEWCLSYFPEPDETAAPIERPKTLPPFSMEGVRAPPDLVKETVIVGDIPEAVKAYGGSWLLPWTGKSPFPYAAYVERLTPTEMTIAFLVKPSIDKPDRGVRYTLTWSGQDFAGKTDNLLGIEGGVTFGVVVSPSGEAMALGFADDREAHFLGCLISSRHY